MPRKEYRDSLKSRGLCRDCLLPSQGKTLCVSCQEKNNARKKKYSETINRNRNERYQQNRKDILEYFKNRYWSNPEKYRKMAIASYNQIAFSGNREEAIARHGYMCVGCGMPRDKHIAEYGVDLNVDHYDNSHARGGKVNNSLGNLAPMCVVCHCKKTWKLDRKC